MSVGATVTKDEPTTSTDPSTDNVIAGLRRAHMEAPARPTISIPAAIHKLIAQPDLRLTDMLCCPILRSGTRLGAHFFVRHRAHRTTVRTAPPWVSWRVRGVLTSVERASVSKLGASRSFDTATNAVYLGLRLVTREFRSAGDPSLMSYNPG